MTLPPPPDALADSLNVIFTRSLQDLRRASWARVDRTQYMQIVTERKQCCAAFAQVTLRPVVAETLLPDDDVPAHILACAQEVDGADRVPSRLSGPASRAPEVGRDDEAGDASDFACELPHQLLLLHRILLLELFLV